MAHRFLSICIAIWATVAFSAASPAHAASSRLSAQATPILEGSPTLAPFQHVRFCLKYPSDCQATNTDHAEPVATTSEMELLNRINRGTNMSIVPRAKDYGSNLEDGWKVAPEIGDCNDYAVTKRHKLIESGISSSNLRLAVVKTSSGIGHLVLVVVTSKGDFVLDNLTDSLRPWQSTSYQWIKIQSGNDPKYWFNIKVQPPSVLVLSDSGRAFRVANR